MFKDNAFVTLTYENDKVPRSQDGRGILVKKDVQDWMKRFRKEVERRLPGDGNYGRRIRYYLVGEYGDLSWRPHFHAILFNYPNCRFGQSRYGRVVKNCCMFCDIVRDTWGRGNILLAECNPSTSSYTCGYVVKKMTALDDPRLKGLPPEFARMSLRPGIGRDAMWEVASTVMEFNLVERQGDVPSSLTHGRRVLPLGRYLTRELRKMVGVDPNAPASVYEKIKEELQPLRVAAFEASRSFRDEVIEANSEAAKRMEIKRRIFKQMRVI